MKTLEEQCQLVIKWAEDKTIWTAIHKTSGEPSIGSLGRNKIVGYLYPKNKSSQDITVIYHCDVSVSYTSLKDRYQLSSLCFSDWEEHMEQVNPD
ncbi:hypothetical protein [Dickeya lacustris]|uniref:Uncharacterized protein n=1 Tax=Dickeya lacustris TaxID=2259638 RepID=A0ABY8G7Q4_9GAMM|nr:hypothetical protein [Dickeya lacustris]WFN55999.1 hypothetical protein O1Q98_01315 [Dickeya lacustris]